MALNSPRFTTNVPQGSAARLEAASRNAPAIGLGEVDVEAVRAIQQALLDLKDPTITLVDGADGSFGNGTVKAVSAFQQRNGLGVDGRVGQNTLARLDALFPAARLPPLPPPSPAAPLPPGTLKISKFSGQAVINGFDNRETDFATRLQNSGTGKQKEFADNVINPLVETLASVAGTVVVVIVGHSDRVDDEGPTREQRRQLELDVSAERAQSAKADVIRLSGVALAARGLAEDEQMRQRVTIITIPCGAAQLEKRGDALTPADRKENRRVEFALLQFVAAPAAGPP